MKPLLILSLFSFLWTAAVELVAGTTDKDLLVYDKAHSTVSDWIGGIDDAEHRKAHANLDRCIRRHQNLLNHDPRNDEGLLSSLWRAVGVSYLKPLPEPVASEIASNIAKHCAEDYVLNANSVHDAQHRNAKFGDNAPFAQQQVLAKFIMNASSPHNH